MLAHLNNQSTRIPQTQAIKNLMAKMRNMENPQQVMQQILSQNPQIAQIIQMGNGDLKSVAQYIAQQKGFDLNALIQDLQNQ